MSPLKFRYAGKYQEKEHSYTANRPDRDVANPDQYIRMGFGEAKIPVPVNVETFAPNETVELKALGGSINTDPPFVNEQKITTPQSRNRGKHIIHFGGEYDSHLLVPVNPKGVAD